MKRRREGEKRRGRERKGEGGGRKGEEEEGKLGRGEGGKEGRAHWPNVQGPLRMLATLTNARRLTA